MFTEETINDKVLKRQKKLKYTKDIEFLNLFKSNIDFVDDEKKCIPVETTFVEKIDDIDRSTLYNFDCPFQLSHADVENLAILGNSATDPTFCLLFVDVFTSKVYVCLTKSRKSIANKMDNFYKEVKKRSKNKISNRPEI